MKENIFLVEERFAGVNGVKNSYPFIFTGEKKKEREKMHQDSTDFFRNHSYT